MEMDPQHPELGAVAAITAALEAAFGEAPSIGLVLGSGLGGVTEALEGARRRDARSLGLPESRVAGHAGEVVVGMLDGVRVVVCSGRVHLYEGWSGAEVVRGVRALHRWGVKHLLLTNSAGAVRPEWAPGTLVRLVDHINLQGTSPLVGLPWGTRFPDASRLYEGPLARALVDAARREGVALQEGVYAAMLGPAYETAAEIRMVRTLGADLVGMSTAAEALAAAEVGLDVAAVSVVSNLATGIGAVAPDHADVTDNAALAGAAMCRLVRAALPLVPAG